jgi:hypothetical protein
LALILLVCPRFMFSLMLAMDFDVYLIDEGITN